MLYVIPIEVLGGGVAYISEGSVVGGSEFG